MVLTSSVCSGDPNGYFTGAEHFQASRRKRNSDRRETIQSCWTERICAGFKPVVEQFTLIQKPD